MVLILQVVNMIQVIEYVEPAGVTTTSDFKTYYRDVVIKTTWYWHQKGHADQRNRFEIPK